LCVAWNKIYGQAPPKGLSSRLLALAVQYHTLVARFGGLKPSTRKRLQSWSDGATSSADQRPAPRARSTATAGTRLVRQWQGKAHIVDVGADGIQYQGRTYLSLTAVAKAITGVHWSGPRFFGL
jgi:hypothetical protein